MKRTWGLRNASAADVGVASLTFALAKPPSKQRPKHPPLEVAIGIVESHEDRYGSARVLFVHADGEETPAGLCEGHTSMPWTIQRLCAVGVAGPDVTHVRVAIGGGMSGGAGYDVEITGVFTRPVWP